MLIEVRGDLDLPHLGFQAAVEQRPLDAVNIKANVTEVRVREGKALALLEHLHDAFVDYGTGARDLEPVRIFHQRAIIVSELVRVRVQDGPPLWRASSFDRSSRLQRRGTPPLIRRRT